MTVSEKVKESTTAARNNAASAMEMSGKARREVEFIGAAIKALADAVDGLDERIDSERRDVVQLRPGQKAIVFSNVSASVVDCYEHAEECARRAQFAATLQLRDDYLDLERSWIRFARTIEASERFVTTLDQDKKNPE